ncbi:MAG: hypothetical protein OXG37_01485 [Actinomycetia bacterium]|nr:hypothetical protein [Actinomycetes bacterium]
MPAVALAVRVAGAVVPRGRFGTAVRVLGTAVRMVGAVVLASRDSPAGARGERRSHETRASSAAAKAAVQAMQNRRSLATLL